MKKIASLLIAALIGLSAVSAQNLKLEANGTEVTEGMTITVEGESDGWTALTCYMQITNTSDKEIEVKLEFSREGLPEGASAMMCGFGQCSLNPFVEGVLAAGEIVGNDHDMPIDIAYTPNEKFEEFVASCTLTDKTNNETLNFSVRFIPTNGGHGTANENRELAGVSVYPNPAQGLFNLNVPARAQVEIFSANGQVVRQMEVGAGQTSLQLNNAGIYFIRVRANGKQAVKRLVVR